MLNETLKLLIISFLIFLMLKVLKLEIEFKINFSICSVIFLLLNLDLLKLEKLKSSYYLIQL